MTNADKAELRRLCRAGDTRDEKVIASLCDCSVATVRRYRRIIKSAWYIDRTRGDGTGFPFALCAPYRDGLLGTAVLGCFAYKPHAECALKAIEAAEKARAFKHVAA